MSNSRWPEVIICNGDEYILVEDSSPPPDRRRYVHEYPVGKYTEDTWGYAVIEQNFEGQIRVIEDKRNK